ncbi:MAG: histone deacetylase [Bryobacterales bacterium]|jgi:acetoin utilization deacetylase AcuC-like enzyme|nr:histone deacetylase [Bryobacterales bacterium]
MSATAPMQTVPLVYHEKYDLNFGRHVFPTHKYRLIRDRLLAEGQAVEEDFHQPKPAKDEDLRLVHTEDWVRKLRTGTITYQEILKLEVPYSRQMVEAFWLAAGGSIYAARLAFFHGVAYNVGGGFHHAFPGHGEGFCAINDVAVAIRVLQREGLIRKALVLDADVHQGNGTAAIFAGDPSVFTLSIHQLHNYPAEKPPSTLDIHLEDGVSDVEYLDKLRAAYVPALQLFRPDFVFYVAGADPYLEDQLGGINLSKQGLMARDRLAIERPLLMGVPVAIALAGGYAMQVEDTVDIHANTWRTAATVLRDCGWRRAPR